MCCCPAVLMEQEQSHHEELSTSKELNSFLRKSTLHPLLWLTSVRAKQNKVTQCDERMDAPIILMLLCQRKHVMIVKLQHQTSAWREHQCQPNVTVMQPIIVEQFLLYLVYFAQNKYTLINRLLLLPAVMPSVWLNIKPICILQAAKHNKSTVALTKTRNKNPHETTVSFLLGVCGH